MEERGLRVAKTDGAFFSKISTTISKLLIPTKIGINGMLITIKRNTVLKNYETCKNNQEKEKEESLQKKYEDAFILYLESIDKYVMDSIYKKVKNRTATSFEEEALSKYYTVIHLKETQYLEYKYRKQKYLLDLDYLSLKNDNKTKLINRYNNFYASKMEGIYKGILKNYSIQLADKVSQSIVDKDEIYDNIFDTLEDYIRNILPIRIENDGRDEYKEIIEEYEKFNNFLAGKLDERDKIEKKMYLLAISRKLFTHSLPLVVAEQCYDKLLKETRHLIISSKIEKKKQKAYEMLITLIEDYNIRLLSTKIYWEVPKDREEYKKFWDKYQKLDKKTKEGQTQKEILFIKEELKRIEKNLQNKHIIKFYKDKLASLGVIKLLKNSYSKGKNYTKKVVRV
ncbi:MAG: hypothetical protein HFJ54_07125 [Clostridia bacterium]|nr:hypothetical protein [Clostridia bacterium]